MNDQFLWTEKYRPHTIQDCILPDDLKSTLQEFVTKQLVPNMLFTGTPGVGKTTAAMALCEEIGCDWIMINGSKERGIDILRYKITNFASTISFSDNGHKVVIVDEADYLTPEAQAAFRSAMEEFASNCTFIFTCNFKAKLMDALHSRCAVIEFKIKNADKAKMATEFMKRLKNILDTEGVKYETPVLAQIIQKHFPDYRRVLNECQRYGTRGPIDVGILAQLGDANINDLVNFLKAKDFRGMRKWVVLNSDIDTNQIYRKIYDSLYDHVEPSSIPQAILLIADYQYKSAFCADLEINLVACLTEIMGTVHFK